MTPSLAAVCAVVFSLAATAPDIGPAERAAAGDAVTAIIRAEPDISALDTEVDAVFAALTADPKGAITLVRKSARPCVAYFKRLREVRYD